MAAIKRCGNRTTELRFRAALVKAGICGWVVQPKGFIGAPDFYFAAEKLTVFVDGCFWHGCPKCTHQPKVNSEYWNEKVKRNRNRDKRNAQKLRVQGLGVIRFWEHQLTENLAAVVCAVRARLRERSMARVAARREKPIPGR